MLACWVVPTGRSLAYASAMVREQDPAPERGKIPHERIMNGSTGPSNLGGKKTGGDTSKHSDAVPPFGRSSKTYRSPPQVAFSKTLEENSREKETPMELAEQQRSVNETSATEVSDTTFPKSKELLEMEALNDDVDKAGIEEGKCLSFIVQTLKEMQQIFSTNHRVNSSVKTGVLKIQDNVESILKCRASRQDAIRRLREITDATIAERTPQKQGSRKRPRGSSETSPGVEPIKKQTADKSVSPLFDAHNHGKASSGVPRPSPVATPTEESRGKWIEDPRTRKKAKKKAKAESNAKTAKESTGPKPTTDSRHDKGQSKKRIRPDAVLIKPVGGKSYADLVKQIRSTVKPEETNTEIRAIRQTKTGGVLLELRKSDNKDQFNTSLKTVLGEDAVIQSLEPKAVLEVRDLDSFTTIEEIRNAVVRDIGEGAKDCEIRLTQANSRGQKFAVISLTQRNANELLKSSRIKVGWVNCRVRRRVEVTKCFKCFGYGHIQADCKGPDRRSQGLCIQCGQPGHKRESCTSKAKCCLCSTENIPSVATEHVPGSRACAVFMRALEKASGSQR